MYEWEEGTGKDDVWVWVAFARVGRSALDMLMVAKLEVDLQVMGVVVVDMQVLEKVGVDK